MCFLIALLVLSIICFIAGWYTLGLILLIPFIGGGIALAIMSSNEKKKQAEQKEEAINQERLQSEELEAKRPAYQSAKDDLILKYGNPDKYIVLEEVDLEKEIIVFGESNRIWLLGNDLLMTDIIGYNVSDNTDIIKGEIISSTRTNTGSAIQRAAVGGLLFGGAGAIVGGNTAKQETITQVGNDIVTHNFTVIININDLSSPILKINLGNNEELVNEIVGLMSVIVNRNNKSHNP